jgi:D-aminoacyl-tRNA deacylase
MNLWKAQSMILVVASTEDVAGMNIAKLLIDSYKFEKTSDSFHQNPVYLKNVQGKEVKLVFVNEEIIQTQFITNHFSPQLLVFVSRHSAQSGIPTLSVHTPGNLTDKAEFGGFPKKVSVSPASTMKDCLAEMMRLKEEMRLDYEVSYECTHHGPSLDVPAMFAELGSSPVQWKNLKAAEAVAQAVMHAISKQSKQSEYQAVLGIGGPHYNDKFTKVALETRYAFGHVIPKYVVAQVDYSMVRQCVERTLEKVEAVVLDWKGIKGADKEPLKTILHEINIKVEKI